MGSFLFRCFFITLPSVVLVLGSVGEIVGFAEPAAAAPDRRAEPQASKSELATPEAQLAEAEQRFQQGIRQMQVSQFREALQVLQQALDLYRAPSVRSAFLRDSQQGETRALRYLGEAYQGLGEFQQAIEIYEQNLRQAREIQNRRAEGIALNNLGNAYLKLRRYPQAIQFYQHSLALASDLGDRQGEASVLSNLGAVYRNQSDYQRAIASLQQSLTVAREYGDELREAVALNNLGSVYHDLGQYQRAIDVHQQSLSLSLSLGNPQQTASALNNLSRVYNSLGQHQTAIDLYEQSLSLAREVGDRQGESVVLTSLGLAYLNLGEIPQAIDFHRQSLALARQVGDRRSEGYALGNLGVAFLQQGRYPEAMQRYQQALILARAMGDPWGESLWLSNIGGLLSLQDSPELAIAFYKQSVNVRETIRASIRGLPQEQQQSFTTTIADDYRELADLLLQSDRVLEAQEVLDLLKLQELQDYDLQNVRPAAADRSGIALWPAERAILDQYSQHIQRAADRDTPLNFDRFRDRPEVMAHVTELQRNAQGQNLNPQQLVKLQDNLQALSHAALLYPLILEDRLELILVTPDSLVHKTVQVDQTTLKAAIATFRANITRRSSNPMAEAQQLYQWLVAPLASDLSQADIETILYAADGALRYIPIAALHDGNEYLVQSYTLNHITAASLTDFSPSSSSSLRILAGAFPASGRTVDLGTDQVWFDGLPYAQAEVENLEQTVPNTLALFSDGFSRTALEPEFDHYTVVHLATHAEFRSGHPTDSYILLGDGDRITLFDLDEWQLQNVNLVVLSACKTAVSASNLESGAEILGFGYQIQRTGADAAIASLWYVSDGGTQQLMNAFYTALQNGYGEAAALRRAQTALITHDNSVSEGERGIQIEPTETAPERSPAAANTLSHPYYWAPFILIGNGL